MGTIKITDRKVKAQIKTINNQLQGILDVKNSAELSKKEVVGQYKEQLKEIFLNKLFCQKGKTRDSTMIKYIRVIELSDPYLIDGDTTVTCHLKCSTVEMRTNKWNDEVQTSIVYSDLEWHYAHTNMKEVSEEQYKNDLNEWKAKIK